MADVSSATARELDELIAEITMDSNGEDEALSGFEVAFENDRSLPTCSATEPMSAMTRAAHHPCGPRIPVTIISSPLPSSPRRSSPPVTVTCWG